VKVKEIEFNCSDETSTVKIYPIGDVHIGVRNCAEDNLAKLVETIRKDNNAVWFGGGDLCDAVIPKDEKRYDPNSMADWLLQSVDADAVRTNLSDVLAAQKHRLFELLDPIKDKCIGLIEGNHEFEIMRHHNRDFMTELCEHFDVDNLTDCAQIRFKFNLAKPSNAGKKTGLKKGAKSYVRMYASHGRGSGRTAGAEPRVLTELAANVDADIIFKGHSHSYCILPPITVLYLPAFGGMPDDILERYKHAANWGTYMKTYQAGSSTYASRAAYPPRPLYTVFAEVTPFMDVDDFTKLPRPDIRIVERRL